jgi:hypothetical protein
MTRQEPKVQGKVNSEGVARSERRQKEGRWATCLVLPAYEKFHTTSSCDVISFVTTAVDTSEYNRSSQVGRRDKAIP